MSIDDSNGKSIIRLGTVHEWVFKVSLWVAPIAALWFVQTLLAHDRLLGNHTIQISYIERSLNARGVSQLQNVNVGAADRVAATESARTWLTTAEVAEKEHTSERTVLNWIAQNMIEPPPLKSGKAWQIAENFRIVPKEPELVTEEGP